MFRQKHVDFLCIGATVLAAAIALLFVWGQGEAGTAGPTYDARLFDAGRVHTVDIRVEDCTPSSGRARGGIHPLRRDD